MRIKDFLAIALAALLPWSTSGVAVFAVLFGVALLPTLDWKALQSVLKMPASVTVILFFALGVIGLWWSADAAWSDRLGSAGQLGKLLLIPLLLYHFERSPRGLCVLLGFTLSCCVLLAWSWLDWIFPEQIRVFTFSPGVPIKNYITQSQEFSLCAFAIASLAYRQFRLGHTTFGIALILLSLAFVLDMLFVVSARTALVYLPVLLVIFALRHHSLRATLLVLVAAGIVGGMVWTTSPYLRMRVNRTGTEYEAYKEQNAITSTGERLEYWRKSLKFIAEAPIFGHGTGSIRRLFEKDGVGQSGVSAEVIANPHNQTLHTLIQWGVLGGIVLYAMWLAHWRLFLRDDLVSWVGLAAVVENFTSSLLNSHIADFNEGWLYVLAVGVAGGMVLKQRSRGPADPANMKTTVS